MIAPPTPGALPDNADGTRIELLDEQGRRLFHRIVHDAFSTVADVPARDGSLKAVTRRAQRGRFEVLLPLMDAAKEARLISTAAQDDTARQPAQTLLTFDLEETPADDEDPQA